ncbi:unnamed protein product [Lampetra fluviatilis]
MPQILEQPRAMLEPLHKAPNVPWEPGVWEKLCQHCFITAMGGRGVEGGEEARMNLVNLINSTFFNASSAGISKNLRRLPSR